MRRCALVAVRVYVVVFVGATTLAPTIGIEPMFWSIAASVAFVVVHVKVAEFPDVIVVGDTEKVMVGNGGGGGP